MSVTFATRRNDLLARAGLVVLAGIATAFEAPSVIRVLLSVIALVALGDLFIRAHPIGGRESVAVTVTGALVAVLAVGLALDLVPSGLDSPGWAAGLTALALVMIAVLGQYELRPRPDLRDVVRREGVWYGAAAVTVICALLLSVSFTRGAERAPVQLSAATAADGSVAVTLTASEPAGPYDLWLEDGRTERVLRSGVNLAADRPLMVPLERFGDRQMRVALRETGSGEDLRFVIVNPGG